MINNISEGPVRVAAKVDPGGAIRDQEAGLQKAEQVRQARPVEESDQSAAAQKRKRRKEEETSSKFILDQKQIIFEKYDRNGDLILRVPPSYKPVDERA